MKPNRISNAVDLLPTKQRLLEALRDHPFLSRRQLELYLHCPFRTVCNYLQDLQARGWVQRHNARQPWMYTRSLLSLTPKGIEEMESRAGVSKDDFIRQRGLESSRLARLTVMMERVFQVRTFLLWLQQTSADWDWSVVQWDAEVEKLYSARGRAFAVPFHGAAVLTRRLGKSESRSKDGCWNTIVVELDLRRVPVEKDRERLVKFVIAQDDPRYWGRENEDTFPIWVLIAQDELRLQDYYAVLRAAAVARQLPMPRAYLTTFSEMLALCNNPALPIWYSTVSGQRTPLLFDSKGSTSPLPSQPPWSRLKLELRHGQKNLGVISPEFPAGLAQESNKESSHSVGTSSVAAVALLLSPIEKRILDEIADHPLLTADAIALLLHMSVWRARQALRKLVVMKFAEEHSVTDDQASQQANESPTTIYEAVPLPGRQEKRYLLADHGIRYLAMIAGFETGVRRYARARGWAEGFDSLLRYWEHTREENDLFLDIARVALRRHHELVWLSELESRLYYDDGHEFVVSRARHRSQELEGSSRRRIWRRSFLPDGRGTYIADGRRYEFALEIDRSRTTQEKFRRKLTEYYACLTSNILRGRGIELLRLLIVTSSWERADTLRSTAVQLERELKCEGLVPIFITTFDRMRASTPDAPIWLRVAEAQPNESVSTTAKTYCFDCFIPTPRPRRKSGPTIYVS